MTVSWKVTDKFLVIYNESILRREETGVPEKTLEVRLRSTETQPTYKVCSRGGGRD